MAKLLSRSFKSLKPHSNSVPIKSSQTPSENFPQSSPKKLPSPISIPVPRNSWTVYLILSTNPPMKTYVGVTNNFSRRLKQHNGELKGGAKASRAGRPWICACLIHGFSDKSAAYQFESKWKSISRKSLRKRSSMNHEQAENSHLWLLQHRQAALNRVRELIDCGDLEFNWHLDPT